MRDIKFRAWHKTGEAMMPDLKNIYTLNSAFQNDNLIFMQFTGFQDSKGVDIYEGDIIYVAGFSRKAKAIITYEHGSEFEDLDGCHRSMINAAAENDIGEIVGNIHQNPELLENK